jgi:hypothetical protein
MSETIKQHFDKDVQRKDCFLCCAAMATGHNYEAAWEMMRPGMQKILKERGTSTSAECHEVLVSLGAVRERDYIVLYVLPEYASTGFLRNTLWGRRAMVQVRSKNFAGEMHIVYWDGHNLHDPSNLRVYEWHEVEPIYLWLFDERKDDA